MNRDHFWLSDRQFAKLKPHLPTDTLGKPRVDDRRVISSGLHRRNRQLLAMSPDPRTGEVLSVP